MQKEFQLTVDIEKKILTPSFEVNTLDLKTIKLKITITRGMTLVDLTGITVRMSIRKPDGNVLFQECQITNAKGGQVEITLENQAYVLPGSYSAEIMCFKGSDKVAVTGSFSYRSIKGIMDDKAVESKSEFTAITGMIKDTQATIEDLRKNGTGIDAQARQEVEQVAEQLADNAYLVPKPDGINDKKIIQDALNHAGRNMLNVKFPPNYTYKVSAIANKENILNIPFDNMVLDLNGSNIQLKPNGFSHYNMLNVLQKKNILIKNGKIQGDRINHDYSDKTTAPTHEFGYGIFIDRSTVTLENMEICEMTGDAVCTIDYIDNGNGSWSDGIGVTRLVNCTLHHCRRQGLSVLCSNEVYVENSRIHTIGDSDGITGTAPSGGIDLEPASRTMRIKKFLIRNSIINCEMSSIICSHNCLEFRVENCSLKGRIMIGDGIANPELINTSLEFEYKDTNFSTGYGNKDTVFYDCRFRFNRFNLKGKYVNCEITGMENPTLSNRVTIYKVDTKLDNTTFKNLRASDFKSITFDSIQSQQNIFSNLNNVTFDNCDISLQGGDFGTGTNASPVIYNCKFKNSYMHLIRDSQEFVNCNFQNMTWLSVPNTWTQALFKMTNCIYVDKTSNIIVNSIRKDIFGSKIELNGIGAGTFGMGGQPSYVTNSYVDLSSTPVNANLANTKIINSFIRVKKARETVDFDSKLTNTVVEFNVT